MGNKRKLENTTFEPKNFIILHDLFSFSATFKAPNLKNLVLNSTFLLKNNTRKFFAGDFNLIFDRNLESAGGNPLLKKHSLFEIIKLNENLNLCDIWRVRNPHKKLFTFRQKHFTGIIQRRLDYIFVLNHLGTMV